MGIRRQEPRQPRPRRQATAGPVVSVIVIFMNEERFLGEAVESVLSQSYRSWELLLVDDGSSDGSSRMARGYAERLPARVHYLEHPGHENRGMSASRNLGIGCSAGEYLAFLDADDVWLPGKLERQVAILADRPGVAMVYGRSRYWFGWTGERADEEHDRIQPHRIAADVEIPPPALLTRFLSGVAAVPAPCSVLVRRDVVEAVGGFEEEFRGLYEDQVFYAKICLEHSVFVSSECLDNYRQHSGSICATAAEGEQELTWRRRYLTWLADYLTTRQAADEELAQALRREIWLLGRPGLPPRLAGRVRWCKKWMLWAEERLLPAGVLRWLWQRRAAAASRSEAP